MWRIIVLAGLLWACGDNKSPQPAKDDAGVTPDAPAPDAPPPVKVGPCIDRPTDLDRPPTNGALPCELLPPGFVQP